MPPHDDSSPREQELQLLGKLLDSDDENPEMPALRPPHIEAGAPPNSTEFAASSSASASLMTDIGGSFLESPVFTAGATSADSFYNNAASQALAEQLCKAIEQHMSESMGSWSSLLDAAVSAPVTALFDEGTAVGEKLDMLRTALAMSTTYRVDGSRVVARDAAQNPAILLEPQLSATAYPYMPPHLLAASFWGMKGEAEHSSTVGSTDIDKDAMDNGQTPFHVPSDSVSSADQLLSGSGFPFWPYPWMFDPNAPQSQGPAAPSNSEERKQKTIKYIAKKLREPPKEWADRMYEDGSICIQDILKVDTYFRDLMNGNPQCVVRAIKLAQKSIVALDEKWMSVRLMTNAELVCAATRSILSELVGEDARVTLVTLLDQPEIAGVMKQMTLSSSDGLEDSLKQLQEMLVQSDELDIEENGELCDTVVTWNAEKFFLNLVEGILEDADDKGSIIMKREGELSLSYLLDHPRVFRALERASLKPGEAALDLCRRALAGSAKFILDESGWSVKARGVQKKWKGEQSKAMQASGPRAGRQGRRDRQWPERPTWAGDQVRQGSRIIPGVKDSKVMRDMLKHYFAPFSLQHIRVFAVMVEEQMRLDKSSDGSAANVKKPAFTVEQLRSMPRFAELMDKYIPEASAALLAAALQGEDDCPVKLQAHDPTHGARGRGAWFSPDPVVELTYLPDLRYVQVVRDCPEVRPLTVPLETAEVAAGQAFPGHAICVFSLSVSSDLSSLQSPKVEPLHEDIDAGVLEQSCLDWAVRLQKIRRQVSCYSPDVVCLQGLQSVGFEVRCNEADPDWFAHDNESNDNHLVHLYRELSKENYGVAFVPTLKQPGADTVVFGNAVFWKRSRWHCKAHYGASDAAVVVELISRLEAPNLMVASSKSAASYAQDWGDDVSTHELAGSYLDMFQVMTDPSKADVRKIWCGDFQGHIDDLQPFWQDANVAQAEHFASSVGAVLGADAWTSASPNSCGKTVDFVLHGSGLDALAALGGKANSASLATLLQEGNPSDHLAQVAVFVDTETHGQQKQYPSLSDAKTRARRSSRGGKHASPSGGHLTRKAGGGSTEQNGIRGRWRRRSGSRGVLLSRSGSVTAAAVAAASQKTDDEP
eukprot:TRINITY_DN34048_c0_g3_i2.p1 TRINITY_DN34048_c0_g3~~TRINITY_DN34048_c0_g3_i2.p1  ORF type:complete len:1107 (+),score=240.28 TRINITY_DN34048_c0_g3_i2:107-3427(+)